MTDDQFRVMLSASIEQAKSALENQERILGQTKAEKAALLEEYRAVEAIKNTPGFELLTSRKDFRVESNYQLLMHPDFEEAVASLSEKDKKALITTSWQHGQIEGILELRKSIAHEMSLNPDKSFEDVLKAVGAYPSGASLDNSGYGFAAVHSYIKCKEMYAHMEKLRNSQIAGILPKEVIENLDTILAGERSTKHYSAAIPKGLDTAQYKIFGRIQRAGTMQTEHVDKGITLAEESRNEAQARLDNLQNADSSKLRAIIEERIRILYPDRGNYKKTVAEIEKIMALHEMDPNLFGNPLAVANANNKFQSDMQALRGLVSNYILSRNSLDKDLTTSSDLEQYSKSPEYLQAMARYNELEQKIQEATRSSTTKSGEIEQLTAELSKLEAQGEPKGLFKGADKKKYHADLEAKRTQLETTKTEKKAKESEKSQTKTEQEYLKNSITTQIRKFSFLNPNARDQFTFDNLQQADMIEFRNNLISEARAKQDAIKSEAQASYGQHATAIGINITDISQTTITEIDNKMYWLKSGGIKQTADSLGGIDVVQEFSKMVEVAKKSDPVSEDLVTSATRHQR